MERKEFIKKCSQLCFGSLIVGGLLESCTTNYYAISNSNNNDIVVKKSEFFELKDGISKLRKFVLVRTEKLSFPLCIFKLNENTYSTLLMECSHKSCELNPHGSYLICPCHGSEFNNLGHVQNPPADADLQSFKTTHDNENIYIHLS